MAKKSVTHGTREDDNACLMCQRADLSEVEFGKLHKLGNLRAHYYCLLFSSGLQQSGKHDHQGILGFMPRDIMSEISRGKRLRCCYCKHHGATVGCVFKKCRRAYHLPCGLNNGVMLQFFGSFPTYCIDHRFYQSPVKWDKKKDVWCSLCLEHIVPEVSADTLYPPCCKNGWFHKLCVQMQALKAGYFFRCPLCNNTSIFNEAMAKFGVHIPEQDAAWETEPGAFQDMYVQHSNCDVPTCICPNGRNYDEDSIGKSPWELVRCKTCGSQGTHIGCSKLPLSQPEWMCTMCTPVVASKGTPPKKQQQESYNFRTRVGRARGNIHRTRGNRQKPSRHSTRKRKVIHQLPSRSSSSSSSSCSPPPVRATDSPPPGCVVSKDKSVELLKYFGDRGYRETRNSDSDVSDDCKRGFKFQRSSSPNSDSNSDSDFHNKKQTSPNFHLKRPASFGSSVDSVSDVHPMKKPYFSSSANPLVCPSSNFGETNQNLKNGGSPNKITMRQLFQQGWHGYSGSTVFLQTSEEDDDNKPMPMLSPSIKEPELIVIDSSDEGELVSKPNKQTVLESGVQSLTSNNKSASSSSPSSSGKESEVEKLSPPSVKKVASGEQSCIPKESGFSGQESILKYVVGPNNMQFSVVSTKTKHRKRSPKSEGSMKITSFYQSASKTFSVGFSDEDDDNTVPIQ